MCVRVVPIGGTATDFLLDGIEIAEEIAGVGVTSYVGPGLISQISGTTRTIYHADGLGSTRAMSGSSQVVTESGVYDAYGNAVATYGTAQSFGYAGQYRYYAYATGLHYLKARYYDPVAGRFLSRDPIGFRGGPNLYTYVADNPVMYVDPTGKSRIGDVWKGVIGIFDPDNWGYGKPDESFLDCWKRCMCQFNSSIVQVGAGAVGGFIVLIGDLGGGKNTLGPGWGTLPISVIGGGAIGGSEIAVIGGTIVVGGVGAWTSGSAIGCAASCGGSALAPVGDWIGDWLGRMGIWW